MNLQTHSVHAKGIAKTAARIQDFRDKIIIIFEKLTGKNKQKLNEIEFNLITSILLCIHHSSVPQTKISELST